MTWSPFACLDRATILLRVSRAWSWVFRVLYAFLGLVDPLIRSWFESFGLGNVVEVRLVGRRSGRPRTVLLGLLRTTDQLYLGHPNGEVAWTLNLASAGRGELRWHQGPALEFRPVRLADGNEREAAIQATDQHPFPGNVIYRAGRGHIREVGVYFRLEPLAQSELKLAERDLEPVTTTPDR